MGSPAMTPRRFYTALPEFFTRASPDFLHVPGTFTHSTPWSFYTALPQVFTPTPRNFYTPLPQVFTVTSLVSLHLLPRDVQGPSPSLSPRPSNPDWDTTSRLGPGPPESPSAFQQRASQPKPRAGRPPARDKLTTCVICNCCRSGEKSPPRPRRRKPPLGPQFDRGSGNRSVLQSRSCDPLEA